MRKLSVLLILVLMLSTVVGVSAAPQPPMSAKGPVQGASAPAPLTPGTLWANGSYDDINGLASELNTAVSDARTADDFELATGCALYDITQIRATHMTSSSPYNAQVELYADSGGNGPGALIATFPMSSAAFLGYSQYGWDMVEYTYNTPGLQLAPGHYWLSSIGLGDGTYYDRSFFATAGNGVVQLQEGYFLSNSFGFVNWTPGTTVYGYYSDYAFDVDGSCPVQNTMHVGAVNMSKTGTGPWVLTAKGQIHDAAHVPLAAVLVQAQWLLPNGTKVYRSFSTGAQGGYGFNLNVPGQGQFRFCVVGLVKVGWTYDKTMNHPAPPCKYINTP
jgi:hypothetical protein